MWFFNSRNFSAFFDLQKVIHRRSWEEKYGLNRNPEEETENDLSVTSKEEVQYSQKEMQYLEEVVILLQNIDKWNFVER